MIGRDAKLCAVVCVPVALCQLRAIAAADVPKGTYALALSSERTVVYDENGQHTPSCGGRAILYLGQHSSFEVSYTGAVMVDNEEWILEGERESSQGVELVARRPKLVAGLTVEIHFRVSNGRAEGLVGLSAASKDKRSQRCVDARWLSGTYKP